MRIDDNRLRAEANNLTLVRLALASAVIWTHSYWRATGIAGTDSLAWLFGAPLSSRAVDGFFFLSGFLVYASLGRRGPRAFVVARAARLWPGLAVAVLAMTLAGALLTRLPPAAYWTDRTTLHFLFGNLSLTGAWYTLGGVRCGAELCNINGSLWTIPWEVRCYALLGLLGFLGAARPAWMRRLWLPLTLAFALGWHFPGVADEVVRLTSPAARYYLGNIDRLWTMFALGIAASIWRRHLPLAWPVLAGLAAIELAGRRLGLALHLDSLTTGYAVLCGGFLTAPRRALSADWPDYSYGMYIYAFPVMMMLAAWHRFTSPALLSLAVFVATLPLAALSWHLVESPVLDRVRGRRRHVPAQASTGAGVATA